MKTLIYLGFWFIPIFGWVANIVKLVHMTEVTTGIGVTRIIGIVVPPIGVVMGFI